MRNEYRAAGQSPQSPFSAEQSMAGMMAAAKGFEPIAKAMIRANAETMTLMSQRAQAYMALPSRMAACRTPHDLMTEQVRFMQTAMQQYTDAWRNVAAAWAPINPMAAMMGQVGANPFGSNPFAANPFANNPFAAPFAAVWGFGASGQKSREAAPERDYITFPEPKLNGAAEPRDRRAA